MGRPRLVLLASLLLSAAAAVPASAGAFGLGPLVQASGSSPFAACTADAVASQPGTMVPHSEVEPWVDVNPTNPDNVAGSFQQDRWSNGGARGLVSVASFDGGLSWTPEVVPGLSLCSGGTFQRATDPWLSFSPNGHLYQMSLVLDISEPPGRPGGFGRNAMLVSKSVDGGLTWGPPVTLIEDSGGELNDKNSLTADPTNPSYVYAVWDRLDLPEGAEINPERGVFGGGLGFKGAALFSRTTDGGATWEPAKVLYDPGGINQTIGNQIVVTPNGAVYDFFDEILNFRNDDHGGPFELNLSFKVSPDKGSTWLPKGRPVRVAKMMTVGVTDPDDGTPVRTGDILPEVAAGPDGELYAVWQDARFTGFDQVAFSMSSDGGRTWSAPARINKTPAAGPPLNRQAFTPSVHASAGGTVSVTYYDFRNNDADGAAGELETDYWAVHCHATCSNPASWEDEKRLTDASFDMRLAPFARGYFTGDYEGLDGSEEQFAAFFSASHGADPASVFFRRFGP